MPQGTVTAAWFESEADNFAVQHEFVHLSFHKQEFQTFIECLNEAWQKHQRDDGTRWESL